MFRGSSGLLGWAQAGVGIIILCSFDAGVGIGVHHASLSIAAFLVHQFQHSLWLKGIEANLDVFALQHRRHFIQNTVQSEGAVIVHPAADFVFEDLIQIHRGIQVDDVVSLLQPRLQGCFPTQSPMGRSVVLGFQPGMKAGVQIRQTANRFFVQRPQERISDCAEDPLHLTPTGWVSDPGVDQRDAENREDAQGLGGDKG